MLVLNKLSVSYPELSVINALCLQLEPGTICVLTGANGCGKSTLLSAISGVIPEHVTANVSGEIQYQGTDLRKVALNEKFHYLWHAGSDADSQFFFPTCEAELAFALENKGIVPQEIKDRISNAAAYFGLSGYLQSSPLSLSGGQKRLLLCAIGKALNPSLYLLDEPASGLSGNSLILLCNWLSELKEQGAIVLIAEHNPQLIGIADRVINLSGAYHDPS